MEMSRQTSNKETREVSVWCGDERGGQTRTYSTTQRGNKVSDTAKKVTCHGLVGKVYAELWKCEEQIPLLYTWGNILNHN